MSKIKVNVKWGKEKFTDVECCLDEPPLVFKAQLFALCGVSPDRQKLMFKGAVIKDDDWEKIKLKQGAQLLLMGSVEEITAPETKTVFVEDMDDDEYANAMEIPCGLQNLGNTCYMNSTIQCLRSVPELCSALQRYSGSGGGGALAASVDAPHLITNALKLLVKQLDEAGGSMPPFLFLSVLHQCYPHFAEKTEKGVYQQQDASECWTEIVGCLNQRLPKQLVTEDPTTAAGFTSFVDQYMGIRFRHSLKCVEAPDDPATETETSELKLSCHIVTELKYMATGLRNRLREQITKRSETLGRDAVFEKTSRISRLPAYLTVEFVRFFYKEGKNKNAKILKEIKFPLMYDAFELCSDELQRRLTPARQRFKDEEERAAEAAARLKEAKMSSETATESAAPIVPKRLPYSFSDDIGSSNSGYYELQAVLTHRGRSSDSGHYIAWLRKPAPSTLLRELRRLSWGGRTVRDG